MNELLSRFDPDAFIGLVAVAGGLIVGLVCATTAIFMNYSHQTRKAEMEAALKQDMLNRGLSAEEIRTVIDAGSRTSRKALRRQCYENA